MLEEGIELTPEPDFKVVPRSSTMSKPQRASLASNVPPQIDLELQDDYLGIDR